MGRRDFLGNKFLVKVLFKFFLLSLLLFSNLFISFLKKKKKTEGVYRHKKEGIEVNFQTFEGLFIFSLSLPLFLPPSFSFINLILFFF